MRHAAATDLALEHARDALVLERWNGCRGHVSHCRVTSQRHRRSVDDLDERPVQRHRVERAPVVGVAQSRAGILHDSNVDSGIRRRERGGENAAVGRDPDEHHLVAAAIARARSGPHLPNVVSVTTGLPSARHAGHQVVERIVRGHEREGPLLVVRDPGARGLHRRDEPGEDDAVAERLDEPGDRRLDLRVPGGEPLARRGHRTRPACRSPRARARPRARPLLR